MPPRPRQLARGAPASKTAKTAGGKKATQSEPTVELSPAVAELISLYQAGNRDGCLGLIPSLTLEEVNTVVDPVSKTTLLMKACETGYVAIIESLLLHGANSSASTAKGETCLSKACKDGKVNVMRALRSRCSDADCFRMLDVAVKSGQNQDVILEMIQILLSDFPMEQLFDSIHNNSPTCLHEAVRLDLTRVVAKLLQHGCAPMLRVFDSNGLSPLQLAEQRLNEVVRRRGFGNRVEHRRWLYHAGKKRSINPHDHQTGDSSESQSSEASVEEREEELAMEENYDFQDEFDGLQEVIDSEIFYPPTQSRNSGFRKPARKNNGRQQPEVHPDVVANRIECFRIILEQCNVEQALHCDASITSYVGMEQLIQQRGISAILNEMSSNFSIKDWPSLRNETKSDSTQQKENNVTNVSTSFLTAFTEQLSLGINANNNEMDVQQVEKSAILGKVKKKEGISKNAHTDARSSFDRDSSGRNKRLRSRKKDTVSKDRSDVAYNALQDMLDSDAGFNDNAIQLDQFLEIMSVAGSLFRRLNSRRGLPDDQIFNDSHKDSLDLRNLTERTTRAIIWCLVQESTELEGEVIEDWATMLQHYTDKNTPVHSLPAAISYELNIPAEGISTYAIAAASQPNDILSCRLILDSDKDPLRGLCHPSVMSILLLRFTQLLNIFLFGITGQEWDDLDNELSSEDLYQRDVDVLHGYVELIIRLILPRIFPVHHLVCAIEKSQSKSVPKKGVSRSLFGEILDIYTRANIGINWDAFVDGLELQMSLINGRLGESTARLSCLVRMKYLVGILQSVTVFEVGALNNFVKQNASAPLSLSNIIDKTLNKKVRKTNSKPRNNNRKNRKNRFESTTPEVVKEGWWLGENWLFLVDALSLHKTDRKSNASQNLVWRYITVDNLKVAEAKTDTNDETSNKTSDTNGDSGSHLKKKAGRKNQTNSGVNRLRTPISVANYIASAQRSYGYKIPSSNGFEDFLKRNTHGIQWLIASTDSSLVDQLNFLLRFPSSLEPDQVLEFVNELLNGVGYEEDPILLNRFTEPAVWVESIVQQLSVSKRGMHRRLLNVEFDDEPGMGPGPMSEFFEITRIFFQTNPLTKRSLADMVSGKNRYAPQTVASLSKPITAGSAPVSPVRVGEITGEMKFPEFSELMPLFVPAGDCNPKCILPASFDSIIERFSYLLSADASIDSIENTNGDNAEITDSTVSHARLNPILKGGSKHNSIHQKLKKSIATFFEVIGVLIGYSIRNEVPMGIEFPTVVWAMLLGETNFNWIDYCGNDSHLLNSCSSILDSQNVNEMQLTFEGTVAKWILTKPDFQLASADLTGALPPAPALKRAPSSASTSGYMEMINISKPLLPNGENKLVTKGNAKQFVYLLSKSRCLNGCEDSILAIRRGLQRIVPQEYLDMLDPIHVMETVRGDDIINVEAIKSSVLYEGGYSEAHRVIRMFWRMVETEFSVDDSRKLLLFWTGNSVSRAETLNDEQVDDRMVISKSRSGHDSEIDLSSVKGRLPEASTCDKHLYLPPYRTLEEMRIAVRAAIDFSCLGYDRT